jgi:hypothetical protein
LKKPDCVNNKAFKKKNEPTTIGASCRKNGLHVEQVLILADRMYLLNLDLCLLDPFGILFFSEHLCGMPRITWNPKLKSLPGDFWDL